MKIVKYPHPSLTTPTIPFDLDPNGTSHTYILEARTILWDSPKGVALAANQVGINYSFFVVREDFAKENNCDEVIINPVLDSWSRDYEISQEGCLSFPGISLDIYRSKNILCRYYDVSGRKKMVELNGFAARVFQHEIEHLDGKTFLQNVGRAERYRIIEKMRKGI